MVVVPHRVWSMLMPSGAMGQEARLEVLKSEFSRVCGLQLLQVLWDSRPAIWEAVPTILLQLTQSHFNQGLREIRTLAEVS